MQIEAVQEVNKLGLCSGRSVEVVVSIVMVGSFIAPRAHSGNKEQAAQTKMGPGAPQ